MRKLLCCLIFGLAVGVYSGVAKSGLALADLLAQQEAPISCCAHERGEEPDRQTPCGQEDCHCTCCLTAVVPAFTVTMKSAAASISHCSDPAAFGASGSCRTIDYPPETA